MGDSGFFSWSESESLEEDLATFGSVIGVGLGEAGFNGTDSFLDDEELLDFLLSTGGSFSDSLDESLGCAGSIAGLTGSSFDDDELEEPDFL